MDISRRLGILVFFMMPAIVGGGLIYALTHGNYMAVGIYEVLLVAVAGGLAGK